MVNLFAEKIATGSIPQGPILVGGAEANSTFDRAARAKRTDVLEANGWADADPRAAVRPVEVNRPPRTTDPAMREILLNNFAHGVIEPLNIYPMLENAFRYALGRSADAHTAAIAELMSKISVIAAANPEHSWFPKALSAAEVMTPTKQNRMMSYPYTKNMVARDEVRNGWWVVGDRWVVGGP